MKLEFNSVEEVISFATEHLGMVYPSTPTDISLDDITITQVFKKHVKWFDVVEVDWVKANVNKTGRMIPAIKLIRQQYDLGLKETKEICDFLRDTLGWFPRGI